MDLQQYLHSIRNRRVAVIGIGVSNTPLVELLCAAGISVTACDRKERAQLGALADRLEAAGTALSLGEHYLDDLSADIIFRTPGMRPDIPALDAARKRGSIITSEMEVFFRLCPCRIIGITGSDGKTTTTTLIAELLRAAGFRVFVGGNIGHPLLCDLPQMQESDIAVVELSSFQLMEMPYSPQLSVMTNLAPNHLDVHRDMEEYVAAKENIFAHQQKGDTAIFNYDNEITRKLSGKAAGSVKYFSLTQSVLNGVYLSDGAIYAAEDGIARRIMDAADIRLPGLHNVDNYMAAIAAVGDLVPDDVIVRVARSFCGVPHRIEFVREVRGVRYYNDSIASSPSRAIAALHSFDEKIIMIAGGYDKHIPFDALGDEIAQNVRLLILCGATANAIRRAVEAAPHYAEGAPGIMDAASLSDAVTLAAQHAKAGENVVLSPACASFDQFRNFEERGEAFKSLVAALSE